MYVQKSDMLIPIAVGAQSLAATAQVGRHIAGQSCVVKRALLTISTATTGASATVVIKVRPTTGSATGELTVGTMTIPNLSVGASIYKDFAGVVANPGYEILADVTVAAGAGAAYIQYVCEEDPETAANNSNLVASA